MKRRTFCMTLVGGTAAALTAQVPEYENVLFTTAADSTPAEALGMGADVLVHYATPRGTHVSQMPIRMWVEDGIIRGPEEMRFDAGDEQTMVRKLSLQLDMNDLTGGLIEGFKEVDFGVKAFDLSPGDSATFRFSQQFLRIT